jgi:hypothetical protein
MQMQTLREIEMAKVHQQSTKADGDMAVQAAKVANEQKLTDIKFLETLARIKEMGIKVNLDQEKHDSSIAQAAVENALEYAMHLNEQKAAAQQQQMQQAQQMQPPMGG